MFVRVQPTKSATGCTDLSKGHMKHTPSTARSIVASGGEQISPLFLTEAEIARRTGVSARQWRAAAHALEKQGLPKRDPLFAKRRHWPAVRDFLDKRVNNLVLPIEASSSTEEVWREAEVWD